jgi:hypothetical protein
MKSGSVLLQLLGGTKNSHALRRWINLWPPFLGMGIRIKHIAPDMKAVDVEMKLHFWNANYVGTHFGGSLFAMTDLFYMLMLMANRGPTTSSGTKLRPFTTKSRGRERYARNFACLIARSTTFARNLRRCRNMNRSFRWK